MARVQMKMKRTSGKCGPQPEVKQEEADELMLSGLWCRHESHTQPPSRWLRFVGFHLAQVSILRRINVADELCNFGPSVRRDKLPIWSRLAQLFYFYFTLKLLASTVLQHQYNRLTWDLTGENQRGDLASSRHTIEGPRVQALEANQTANKSEREHEHLEKREQLELTVARLQLIGNAYYEFGAPIEPLYLSIAYISYLAYLQPQIYVPKRKGLTVDLLCVFFDPERHRRLILAPEIARQASRYVGSSANYLMTRLASVRPAQGPWSSSAFMRAASFGLSGREVIRALELAHERDVQQVAELVASGGLVPPNRQLGWIEWLACVHGGLVLLISLSSTLILTTLLIVLPRMRLTSTQLHNQPRDLLFQAEFLLYCTLSIQCYTFDLVGAITIALDQIRFVMTLERMVVDLIETSKWDQGVGGLNRGLIRVAILYELLKEQLKGAQARLAFIAANIIVFMLLTPVLARLYVTQMAREYRYLYLICSVLVILSCDLAILPYCWLHARSLDMLNAQTRLLTSIDAHLSVVRGQKSLHLQMPWSLSQWRAHHDEHTVCLLRREQQAPELAMRVFAVDAYFMRLTYANLLGVHFWCCLLLAPMCMRDTARALGASDNLLTLIF